MISKDRIGFGAAALLHSPSQRHLRLLLGLAVAFGLAWQSHRITSTAAGFAILAVLLAAPRRAT